MNMNLHSQVQIYVFFKSEREGDRSHQHCTICGGSVRTMEIRTGNQMVDQFHSSYFGVAFAFLFKYSTAYPDVKNTVQVKKYEERRKRGNPHAPEVDIALWAKTMMRRVETQFQRDWTFGPVLWNYLSRTMHGQSPVECVLLRYS
eukprot:3181726-Amphidinium_carterae.1